MYQFSISDLHIFAHAWVNHNCEYSPGTEQSNIMVERIEKELLRVFQAAGEPLQ